MMILLMKRIVKSDGLKNHIKKEISNFFKKICMTKKRQRYFLRNKSIKKRARAIYMGYQTIIK
ncbi:MAG: hypothetical protein IKH66_04480, partial [Campylobacter sp.]|nr:hypothetical protein [Campylobacter sp.]